jgi:hypothetical protein
MERDLVTFFLPLYIPAFFDFDQVLLLSAKVVDEGHVDGGLVYLLELHERSERIQGIGPHEIRFRFAASASAIGTVRLQFVVHDDSTGAMLDSLEVALPVLGQQDPVDVATSMSIVAHPDAFLTPEGVSLPKVRSFGFLFGSFVYFFFHLFLPTFDLAILPEYAPSVTELGIFHSLESPLNFHNPLPGPLTLPPFLTH